MSLIKHPHQLFERQNRPQPRGICAYIDNSNVFIEGQRIAEKYDEDSQRLRIHFRNFWRLVRQERTVREAVLSASIQTPQDQLWRHLDELGVHCDLIPRAETGEHDVVDQALQIRMHRHTSKYAETPGKIVLVTGDGSGYFKEEGFLYDAETFVDEGWDFELLSWTHCCHNKLREFAEEHGRFIALDKFYSSITYIDGGRDAMAVDLDDLDDLDDLWRI